MVICKVTACPHGLEGCPVVEAFEEPTFLKAVGLEGFQEETEEALYGGADPESILEAGSWIW